MQECLRFSFSSERVIFNLASNALSTSDALIQTDHLGSENCTSQVVSLLLSQIWSSAQLYTEEEQINLCVEHLSRLKEAIVEQQKNSYPLHTPPETIWRGFLYALSLECEHSESSYSCSRRLFCAAHTMRTVAAAVVGESCLQALHCTNTAKDRWIESHYRLMDIKVLMRAITVLGTS